METVLILLILAITGFALHLRARLIDVEIQAARIPDLTQRLWRLEQVVFPPAPLPEVRVTRPNPVVTLTPPPLPPPPIPLVTAEPGPSISDRLRGLLGNDEWETLVGASLLNKLGALVLVVGIALFLGFSFGHITPAGRIAVAFAMSGVILAAGVFVERHERYLVFSAGLIGAGWAGLYATAYAAYAIPGAQIVSNPLTGSIGLLAVAMGMIAHSLRYRSQAITSVAYFAAFAALAVTPSSPFAVISLVPLAISLLWLAARFEWYTMPLFGLAATWLTCVSRGDSGAPLVQTQALFLVYWLLFDGFDLLRTRRRIVAGGVEWIYPVNLIAFSALSWLAWSHHAPEQMWIAATAGATLYLADGLLRGFLRPPSSFTDADDIGERIRAGSYESSILVSALLGGLAIVAHVPGVWTSIGLALEAEILYLAGLKLDLPFLRRMGVTAFTASLVRLVWGVPNGRTPVLGHDTAHATPPAIFHAVLFYLNRTLRGPNAVMSSTAAALLAAVIFAEAPVAFIGCVWILFGLVLLELGLRDSAQEFRLQSYVLLAIGVAHSAMQSDWLPVALSLIAIHASALRTRWLSFEEQDLFALASSGASVLLAAILLERTLPVDYLALAYSGLTLLILELGSTGFPRQLRVFFAPAGLLSLAVLLFTQVDHFAKFPAPPVTISFFGAAVAAALVAWRTWKNPSERDASIAVSAGLLMAGCWLIVPGPYVSLAWTAIAIASIEFGWIALGSFGVLYCRLFLYDLNQSPLTSMPFAIAGLYWLWYRKRGAILWVAAPPLLALIAKQSGQQDTAAGWMAAALILFFLGDRFEIPDARRQAVLIAFASFGVTLAVDLYPSRLWISGAVIGMLYVCQGIARPSRYARENNIFSLLATLLLCAVLYARVSGSLLTVFWGFEGLALLAAGFLFRERILRLEGLGLLLLCILRLFLYDLRNLETLYRILSFIALGLILLAVSWIYSRFREHIRRLL